MIISSLQETLLKFNTSGISATVLNAAAGQRISGRAIIVNVGAADAYVHGPFPTALPPLQSVTVVDAEVSGSHLVVFKITDTPSAIAADARAQWHDFYGSRGAVGDFPELLRSPQLSVGRVALDKAVILRQPELPAEVTDFEVLLNLWFSPAGTACGIHNQHDFIEVHTQLTGFGRMQKFSTKSAGTIYEEYLLSPAATNPATFCHADGATFEYPWHQYFADTDCVWLAVEYHAL
ncbi:MAG: hypothetical protein ABIQ09_09165 [Jatrophihabitantaceae bacterium]